MIIEYMIGFAIDVLAVVLDAILPDFDTVIPDLEGAFAGVATLNAFFPITESIGVASMLLTVQGIMFFVKLTQTIVAHIPGIGGSGG